MPRLRQPRLLKGMGKTMADLSGILNPSQAEAVNIFTGFDDWMEKREPGYKAKAAAAAVDWAKREAVYRREVIAKYGSEEKAKADTPIQRAVEDAVKPFARTIMFEWHSGKHPTNTLDGWTGWGPRGVGIVPPRQFISW